MKLLLFITLLSIFSCCKRHDEQPYKPSEVPSQPPIESDTTKPIQVPCQLTKNLDTIKLYIQGTWQWVQEKRMNRALQQTEYLTPKNQGYTLSLILKNDTARFFKNNFANSVYGYKVVRLKEISGTNFPEDEDPVIVFTTLSTGIRQWHVPLKMCDNFLVLQYQYVSSLSGEEIWKKQ